MPQAFVAAQNGLARLSRFEFGLFFLSIDLKATWHGRNAVALARLCMRMRESFSFATDVDIDLGRNFEVLVGQDRYDRFFLFRQVPSMRRSLQQLGRSHPTWFPKLSAGGLAGFSSWVTLGDGTVVFAKYYNGTLERAWISTDNHLERFSLVPYIAIAPRTEALASITRSNQVCKQ